MNNQFEIIAETAFSHEGDFDYLINQINAAAIGKVNYIKFQILIDPENYFVSTHPSLNVVKNWIFSEEQWFAAFNLATNLGLKIIALPLTLLSLNFCEQFSKLITFYEIHAVSFNEVPLLERMSMCSQKIILGIGGRIPSEIEFAIKHINKDISETYLMYGFQSFPTNLKTLNLFKIKEFQAFFKTNLAYADHTNYEDSNWLNIICYSYILGAKLFEKHIVLSKGEKRTDFESGIISADFIMLRNFLDIQVSYLGNGNINKINDSENSYKKREKKIVLKNSVDVGVKLTKENLCYKISQIDTNLNQKDYLSIMGSKFIISKQTDDVLSKEDIYIQQAKSYE